MMTDTQKQMLLLLADVYLRLGRPHRALLLLRPLARVDPDDVTLCRLALRGYLAVGDTARTLEMVERLVEHEFSPAELAFALAMQSRALHGLGRTEAARSAWAECVALCRDSDLDVMEYAR